MDNRRFDAKTRSLAARGNRRTILKGGFTAAIGALTALNRGPVQAQNPCTNASLDCTDSQVCLDGICSDCGLGFEACGEVCADLSSDVYHCGFCGNFCGGVPSPGYSSIGECIEGQCVAVCLPETAECAGECTDLSTDVNNCGSCGNFCGGVPGPGYSSVGECVQGECVAVCLPDADQCDGQCTDLDWDVGNCGSCGNQCATGQICCIGQCVSRDSAERFCDFCGFQGGWPQGCHDDEICSGGLCLAVGSESSGGQPTGSDPADVAYQLSVMESQSEFNDLYDRMHPDAQIVIPRGTVTHWYSQYFAPLGPQPITVTGVENADWTWEVTGRTYSGTAVVSFEQDFANSAPVSEVVHLVQDSNGSWRWFFGRSEAFVESMNTEAGAAGLIDDEASLPDASGIEPQQLFAEALESLDRVAPTCLVADSLFEHAPDLFQGAEKQTQLQGANSASVSFSYLPVDRAIGDAYPDLVVNATTLEAGQTPETMIAAIQESIDDWSGPEFSLPPRALRFDLAPASGYLVSYYEEYTEVLGYVPVITWGQRRGDLLVAISGPAIVAINELMQVWAEGLTSSNANCSA